MTSETQFLQVFWHKILSLNFVQNNGGAFCMRGSGRQGNIPTLRLPVFHGKMRKQKAGSVVERRRKATLPAVLGTPEHCGLIRRDLVVCPPFWLLPRIETGDSFYGPAVHRCCGCTRREMCLHGHLRGEPFGGYGGCPFRSP